MKRKYMALVLGLSLTAVSVGTISAMAEDTAVEAEATTDTGNGEDNGAPEMPEAESGTVGEVTAVGEDSITVEIDGEETTITVTEDTVITKGRGGMGMNGGGDVPDKPDGDGQAPSGDPGQSNGDASHAPSDAGDQSSDSEESSSDAPGEADGQAPSGEMGEAPSGEAPSDLPDGDQSTSQELSLSDIEVGDTVTIELNEDGSASSITIQSDEGDMGQGGGMGQPGGSSQGVDSYDAANEYSESAEISGEEITSTGTDENAILVDGEDAEVTVSDSTITRTSQDSTGGDNSSFYGVGAAVLATKGIANVTNSTITTDAAGGAGLFAYGDGTVYASNDTISTSQDTSGGIHVAGGGTLYAWNLDVTTQGESSAAIRSDRGSGTMVVDGGTYTSNGTGSPAIYSTADITVNNAELTSTSSEAICIEGLNTIRLFDSNLSGNMSDNEQNDVTWNVIVYQSMSGDSEEGNGTFEMNGGTLTAYNGGMFYTTNTESTFILNSVEIIPSEDNDFFLQCTGNSNARGWGSTGSNGADCTFTGINQVMEGDVIWDSISELDFYMTQGSSLTGAIVDDETWAGDGGNGYCNVIIDETSTWTVTGDSTVTSLSCAGTIVDEEGNTVTIQGSDGTVYVEGTSQYTITVENYSDTADTTGASSSSTWTDYEVEKPEALA